MLGLKYNFDYLWFGYSRPQNDGVYELYILWRAIALISVYTQALKCTSVHQSLRGNRKNCRTLNQ